MRKRWILPVLLIAVFALSRWPKLMPQNFSAAYAIVFCAGLYLPGRIGWFVPLAVLFTSDLLITWLFYEPHSFALKQFLVEQWPNYVAYAGLIGLGRFIGRKRSWPTLAAGGLLGALVFYVVTNTAAWFSLPYPKTIAGWIQALTTGFPGYPTTWEFFLKTLLSGGLFTGLFVGAMKLTESSEESAQEKKAGEATDEAEAEPAPAEP